MSYKMSIDIGGTFTDMVVMDEQGVVTIFKSSTTPGNYVDAVIENLAKAAEHFKVDMGEILSQTGKEAGGSFVHGSTITTNALIQRKTAKTGLICTRGFRDILTFREGGKDNPFDWKREYPEPFIPKYLTLPVTGRINSEGDVEIPLDEKEVRNIVRQFRSFNVNAIAVSLLWSVLNPDHELRIGRIIEEEAPEIPYVLGHQVNPIIREYRRTIAAAINASLVPIVNTYVTRFEESLKSLGFPGGMQMLTSSGGMISVEEIVQNPIYTVDCGPSLAPTAGLWFSRHELEKEDIIVTDMGGTSFDISCVTGGSIAVSRESCINGDLLGINKVDTRSIGSGGGSIAWVDTGGLLHVGPDSAGSVPGPACYGRGGEKPTATDANLVLGYLDPAYFLGGQMRIHPELARDAILKEVAGPLHLSLEDAAFSIWSTVNVDLTSAIQDITIWQGIDPREYLFVSGGGAGGMHIIPVVRELGAREVLIPKTASVISAMGGSFADDTSEFAASRVTISSAFDYDAVNSALAELEKKARAFLAQAGISEDQCRIEFFTEARYLNQVWELPVPLVGKRITDDSVLKQMIENFHLVHERILGIKEPEQAVEFMFWRAKAVGKVAHPEIARIHTGRNPADHAIKGWRKAYFHDLGGMVDTPVYNGMALGAGNRIHAPAIIEEPTMTLVVFPGASTKITDLGSYHIELG